MCRVSLAGLAVLLAASWACADDWPQWRGPNRTGVSAEKGLLQKWPRGGPKLAWTFRQAGSGYGSPAVVGGRVYCMGTRDGTEYVYALNEDGKELWATKIATVFDFKSNRWSRGPNATPTVAGGLVYALGSQGELLCVSAGDGKEKWRKNLPQELAAEVNPIGGGPKKMGWGFSWSPLVDKDQLICTPGGPQGLFAALDLKSGTVLWRSKAVTDQATYSSPIAVTLGGKRQYIALTQEGVVSVAAKDGEQLWYYKREDPFPDVVCSTPICSGSSVYVTAGWGGRSFLLNIKSKGDKLEAEEVYADKGIGNRHGGVVLLDRSLFGFDEESAWKCQDLAGGDIKWTSRRNALGPGSISYADGRFYCVSEKDEEGMVGLLEPSSKEYKEVSRFRLPEKSSLRKERGGVWTHPVIANGRLYVRDQELLFCYQIKAAE
jgi:outer membrane protein assembly factor BamB